MNYRCAGAGLAAAGLVMAAPLAAQTTDTGTTAPPRDPQTKPTVSPAQMIGVVKDLLQPKPSPVVFPAPTQQPTPAPAAATAVYTAPVPQPVPTLRPAVAVRPSSSPVALPSIVAPLPSATPPPPATAAESVVESGVAVSQPVPVDLIGPARSPTLPWGLRPWWVWLIVAGAAAGLAELARRWFWPKPTLGCEIAVGAGVLTHAASPPFTAPELNIAIRIEPGEARAPIGHPVLAQGDTA